MPRPLSSEARRKSVAAAQELLATGGIDSFTLDGVARRSGVAKTTLYRHWGSAHTLLVHAIDCMIQRVPTPNTGSFAADLAELMERFRGLANDPANRRLMLDVIRAAASDSELAAVKASLLFERTRPVREILQRAIDRGEIPPVDVGRAATYIEGPLMARMLKSTEPIEAAEISPMVDFVAWGLGAMGPTGSLPAP